MTAPSPGPAPDRAAAEEPEVWSAADEVRCSIENGEWISHQEAQAVLAELDRLRRVETAVRNLFEVMPMGARRYLAEHHGDVNRAWLELDLALLPNDEETQDG